MKTTTADITAALASLPSISLDELNSVAALQTRTDRKYVVGEREAASILGSFDAGVEALETEGRRSFTYESVYFDTAELDAYKLAAHGRRRRYKIRTRGENRRCPGRDREGTHPIPIGGPSADHR